MKRHRVRGLPGGYHRVKMPTVNYRDGYCAAARCWNRHRMAHRREAALFRYPFALLTVLDLLGNRSKRKRGRIKP